MHCSTVKLYFVLRWNFQGANASICTYLASVNFSNNARALHLLIQRLDQRARGMREGERRLKLSAKNFTGWKLGTAIFSVYESRKAIRTTHEGAILRFGRLNYTLRDRGKNCSVFGAFSSLSPLLSFLPTIPSDNENAILRGGPLSAVPSIGDRLNRSNTTAVRPGPTSAARFP